MYQPCCEPPFDCISKGGVGKRAIGARRKKTIFSMGLGSCFLSRCCEREIGRETEKERGRRRSETAVTFKIHRGERGGAPLGALRSAAASLRANNMQFTVQFKHVGGGLECVTSRLTTTEPRTKSCFLSDKQTRRASGADDKNSRVKVAPGKISQCVTRHQCYSGI